ncbi:hypothetical protein [Streptomyces celluloflavus]|uniref:hypothetical protein n=1 Tax=Streptomyces celluloflavus TaxID=58344 RepID=UPI0034606F64
MATGNLVHGGAVISCPHGGLALSTAAGGSDGVRIDGAPVATTADLFTISGCPQVVDGRPQPCTSLRWLPDRAADAVRIDGVPVLLDTTAAMCFNAGLVPQGPPVAASVHRSHQVHQGDRSDHSHHRHDGHQAHQSHQSHHGHHGHQGVSHR